MALVLKSPGIQINAFKSLKVPDVSANEFAVCTNVPVIFVVKIWRRLIKLAIVYKVRQFGTLQFFMKLLISYKLGCVRCYSNNFTLKTCIRFNIELAAPPYLKKAYIITITCTKCTIAYHTCFIIYTSCLYELLSNFNH